MEVLDNPKVEEKEFMPLAALLVDSGFSVITTPFILTKENLSEWLVKHLSQDIEGIYVVGWREKESPFYLTFPDLLDKASGTKNSLFIVEDLITFSGYIGEINSLTYTGNFFLIITDTLTDPTSLGIIDRHFPDAVDLWPAPLDIPIDIVYNRKESLITGGQLKQYNHEFVNWRKLDHETYGKINPPESLFGALNVYLDSRIPSLESQPKDIAFQRSPKFRDMIQSILLHRKKRHFIGLISGEKGIDSFQSLYNMIDVGIPLHVIRSSDPLRVKETKIEEINSSNAPMVLVSDFYFTDDMAIKNIDYYHITDGGKMKDLICIISLLKGNNYTGTYPRKFIVNNYITETPTDDTPLDALMEKDFSSRLNKTVELHKNAKNYSLNIVFVEDKLEVVLTQ